MLKWPRTPELVPTSALTASAVNDARWNATVSAGQLRRADDRGGGGGARIAQQDRDPVQWPCDARWLPTDVLAHQHPFDRDQRILFDEPSHTYYVLRPNAIQPSSQGGEAAPALVARHPERYQTCPLSVTGLIASVFEPFLWPKQVSAAQIIRTMARNEAGCVAGTTMHAALECLLNSGVYSQDARIRPEMRLARERLVPWLAQHDLVPYRTEPTVYLHLDRHVLCGSVDLVARHRATGEFWILDWKRSKKDFTPDEGAQYKQYGRFPPFDGLVANSLNKYSIQLHLYRLMLQPYGIDVPLANMRIVRLHVDKGFDCIRVESRYEAHARWLIEHYDACLERAAENRANVAAAFAACGVTADMCRRAGVSSSDVAPGPAALSDS